MRNTIVHNIDEISGWSLDSEEGISIAHGFLSELLRLSGIIIGVFLGIMRAWSEDNQMEAATAEIPRAFLLEIDLFYKPLAQRWFFEKE